MRHLLTLPGFRTEVLPQGVHRWILAAVMIAVVVFGWKFPLLGFAVPVVMATGIVGSMLRGRYTCGHLCPRGSFLDTFLAPFAAKRPLPSVMGSMKFRSGVVVALMGFMGFRLLQDPSNPYYWGEVFWMMCLVTTIAAVALGIVYRGRGWCAVCPVGTMMHAIGGGGYDLTIAATCRECALCETHCPMEIPIASYARSGSVSHRDCLKCSSCVQKCPSRSLAWPR